MTHSATERVRADVLLTAQGLATSRARAQSLIKRGRVAADGRPVTRAGELFDSHAIFTISPAREFVSRGGDKLDAALDALGVSVEGAVVVDVGASTGGFTDCVLQRGAQRVYAIDVGHGQLHPSLGSDPRVVARERINARDLRRADFDDPIDVVLVDASFIGLGKLAPALARILPEGGQLIALVKPQFEVGPAVARRLQGVIRDRRVRDRAISEARAALVHAGFRVLAECDSSLAGPRGNVERFVVAVRVT